MRRWIVLAFVMPGLAQAQYRRQPGDTVRVRERTMSAMTIQTPRGEVAAESEHDAIVALTFGRADSATAWYESLRVAATSPAGKMAPSTDAALAKPFHLRFDPRGRITLLAAPTFAPELASVADLTRQFDDLYLRLPAEPLRVGLEWSDTLVIATTGDKQMRTVHRGRYRVTGDTVVDGTAAMVIAASQELESSGEGPVPNAPVRAQTTLAGNHDGIFVFSPSVGRMLGRRRTGQMRGETVYVGGPQPIRITQVIRYTNDVTAIAARP
jgi:hypothetical protein